MGGMGRGVAQGAGFAAGGGKQGAKFAAGFGAGVGGAKARGGRGKAGAAGYLRRIASPAAASYTRSALWARAWLSRPIRRR